MSTITGSVKLSNNRTLRYDKVRRYDFNTYRTAIEAYLANEPHFTIQCFNLITGKWGEEDREFTQFEVRGGLHSSTSVGDTDPSDHFTIRMTSPAFKGTENWFVVLHWRPNGGHKIMPGRDCATWKAQRVQSRGSHAGQLAKYLTSMQKDNVQNKATKIREEIRTSIDNITQNIGQKRTRILALPNPTEVNKELLRRLDALRNERGKIPTTLPTSDSDNGWAALHQIHKDSRRLAAALQQYVNGL